MGNKASYVFPDSVLFVSNDIGISSFYTIINNHKTRSVVIIKVNVGKWLSYCSSVNGICAFTFPRVGTGYAFVRSGNVTYFAYPFFYDFRHFIVSP